MSVCPMILCGHMHSGRCYSHSYSIDTLLFFVSEVCHENNYVGRCYAYVADGIATVAGMCHLILYVIVVGCGRWENHCGR